MRQLIVGLALVLLPLGAWGASSNQTMNVQGVLRDTTGNLQSMAVGLDVSLYASLAATTSFYTQHFTAVPVDNGFFTVELAGAALVFAGKPDTFIGIQVTGDPEELPRQHLDSAPYCFVAASADTLSSACVGCITNTMLGGSIDGSKVSKVASADAATPASQLGGVDATGWQKAITPAACPSGQVYSGITAAGVGTCTSLVSTVAFSSVSGVPAACTGGQFLVGYTGGAAVCAGLNFTTSGGNNGTATTVARGDHTHPGVGSGWVKIYDQAYNANGTQTINITPVNNTYTVRILFNGILTGCCGNPSEIYLRTSAGGTTGYNSFLVGETVGGTTSYNVGPLQSGFLLGRTTAFGNAEMSFDYELTELPSLGAIGHGTGAVHPDGNATTTMFRGGGNLQYTGSSTSLTIQFWNTSNVNGRFTVLQLM